MNKRGRVFEFYKLGTSHIITAEIRVVRCTVESESTGELNHYKTTKWMNPDNWIELETIVERILSNYREPEIAFLDPRIPGISDPAEVSGKTINIGYYFKEASKESNVFLKPRHDAHWGEVNDFICDKGGRYQTLKQSSHSMVIAVVPATGKVPSSMNKRLLYALNPSVDRGVAISEYFNRTPLTSNSSEELPNPKRSTKLPVKDKENSFVKCSESNTRSTSDKLILKPCQVVLRDIGTPQKNEKGKCTWNHFCQVFTDIKDVEEEYVPMKPGEESRKEYMMAYQRLKESSHGDLQAHCTDVKTKKDSVTNLSTSSTVNDSPVFKSDLRKSVDKHGVRKKLLPTRHFDKKHGDRRQNGRKFMPNGNIRDYFVKKNLSDPKCIDTSDCVNIANDTSPNSTLGDLYEDMLKYVHDLEVTEENNFQDLIELKQVENCHPRFNLDLLKKISSYYKSIPPESVVQCYQENENTFLQWFNKDISNWRSKLYFKLKLEDSQAHKYIEFLPAKSIRVTHAKWDENFPDQSENPLSFFFKVVLPEMVCIFLKTSPDYNHFKDSSDEELEEVFERIWSLFFCPDAKKN